jgi:hypothetical protein
MPPTPTPTSPAAAPPAKPATHAAAPATPVPLDWDATITLIEYSLPSQYFAFELIRELGRALQPPTP